LLHIDESTPASVSKQKSTDMHINPINYFSHMDEKRLTKAFERTIIGEI